jgi:predicted transposase YdaD
LIPFILDAEMEKPYDPALKTLAELAPADWLPLAKRRRRRVRVEDSDVGTIVSGASDKLFRVFDQPEYLLHLDFEAGHFRSELPLRLRLYNSLFEYRHDRVVLSVTVLLRPEADSPQWNGRLERGLSGEEAVSTLRYEVIRVWTLDPEKLLAGGIGTLALAPISAVTESETRGVIQRMKERLSGPKAPRKAGDVWAATYVLLGLRYNDAFAKALFEEVLGMEESATYQAIISRGRVEGRTEGERRLLLLQGEEKFGPPDAATRAAIEAITDLAHLEELGVRLVHVSNWQDLLASATPRRRKSRRKNSS